MTLHCLAAWKLGYLGLAACLLMLCTLLSSPTPPQANERSLLTFLMARLRTLDVDVFVGHNFAAFDLDVLLHRLQHHKVLARVGMGVWSGAGPVWGVGGAEGALLRGLKWARHCWSDAWFCSLLECCVFHPDDRCRTGAAWAG